MIHKYSARKVLRGLGVALDEAWTLWDGTLGSWRAGSPSSKCPQHSELRRHASPSRPVRCGHVATVLLSSSSPLLRPHLSTLQCREALPTPLARTSDWVRCHAYVFPKGPGFLCITVDSQPPVSSTTLSFWVLSIHFVEREPQKVQCLVTNEWIHYWITDTPDTAPCFDNKCS